MSENTTRRFQTSGDLTSELVGKIYITFCGGYRQSRTHKVLMVVLAVEMVLLLALNQFNGESNKSLLPFADVPYASRAREFGAFCPSAV